VTNDLSLHILDHGIHLRLGQLAISHQLGQAGLLRIEDGAD